LAHRSCPAAFNLLAAGASHARAPARRRKFQLKTGEDPSKMFCRLTAMSFREITS